MKITIQKKQQAVKLADVKSGDMFLFGGDAYLKLNDAFSYPCYRIGVYEGGHSLCKNTLVIPVSEVVIKP